MSETNGLVDAAEFEPPAVYETSENYDKYGAIAGSGNTPTMQSKFYDGNTKSVLGSWNYTVEFSDPEIFKNVSLYHVLDVTIPTYNFKQNTVVYGSVPKSYVTFDSEKQYQFAVTFEEDRFGTITALAYAFQKRIMGMSGMYNSLLMQMLGDCTVVMYDGMNVGIMSWKMKDIRFLGIEDVSLSYTTTDSMKLKMTFACDIVDYKNYSVDDGDMLTAYTNESAGAGYDKNVTGAKVTNLSNNITVKKTAAETAAAKEAELVKKGGSSRAGALGSAKASAKRDAATARAKGNTYD